MDTFRIRDSLKINIESVWLVYTFQPNYSLLARLLMYEAFTTFICQTTFDTFAKL